MTCFHPLSAYYPLFPDSDGKRFLRFGSKRKLLNKVSSSSLFRQGFIDLNTLFSGIDFYDNGIDYPVYYDKNNDLSGLNIKIPCGKCIGCRLDYSRSWATRSIHEAFMCNHYTNCSFLTLTFNDNMLLRRENPHSVNKTAFRSWLKRLRYAIKSEYNKEIRVMYCGEYGARGKRPHYHMIVFGFNFPDKYIWKYNKIHGIDCTYYRSPFLESVWRPAHDNTSYGFSVLGDVTFESSAYVARYIMKKQYGPIADKVYKDKEKEFMCCSRMPGLGASYFDKFYPEIINNGFVVLPNGKKTNIPRYYVNRLESIDENMYKCYKVDTFNKLVDNLFVENLDATSERLKVREEFKQFQLDKLHRNYEFDDIQNISDYIISKNVTCR